MPATPEQRRAQRDHYQAAAARISAEDARTRAAAAPAGAERDAALEEATESFRAAAAAAAEAQLASLGKGMGTELLDHRLPVLLLPVRLELRLAWRSHSDQPWAFEDPGQPAIRHALVRIAPDVIHTDTHDPALTPAELVALQQFEATPHDRPHTRTAAYTQLAQQVGPARALWVARQNPKTVALAPAGWSRQAITRLLPDRWRVTVHVDSPFGPRTAAATSNPVTSPLPLTLDPLDPDPVTLAWVEDFDAAVKAGMAVAVPLVDATGTALTGQPRRVVAVGACIRHDPNAASEELVSLIDAHHMTHGVRVPTIGQPTSSSSRGPAVTAQRAAITEEIVAAEHQRTEQINEAAAPDPRVPGDRLAAALGTLRAPWRVLPGALDDTTIAADLALRNIVATVVRPALDELLAPGLATTILNEYTSRIETFGPLPSLLIGNQPYGVLPITPLIEREAPQGTPLATVERIRQHWWEPATQRTPRLGRIGQNTLADLAAVLGRDAAPHTFAIRPGVMGILADHLTHNNNATDPLPSIEAAFGPEASAIFHPLLNVLFAPGAQPATAPTAVIDRREQNGPLVEPSGYLDTLATAKLADIVLGTPGLPTGVPAPLLYEVARAALVAEIDTAIRQIILEAPDPVSIPDWTAPISDDLTESLWTVPDRLNLGVNAAQFIIDTLQQTPTPGILTLRFQLERLRLIAPATLDALFRQVLGLSSRIDPWYTAHAWELLTELRRNEDPAAPVRRGLQVGGYGVLEEFMATTPSGEEPHGFIHAPGVAHGTSAAVLHAAHRQRHRDALGHDPATAAKIRATTALHLDSAAVRRALQLLDGLRAGQSLAELLGAQLETGLAARNQQKLIASLRSAYPGGQGPRSVTVNGLSVLDAAGFPDQATIPLPIPSDADTAADLADAVADTAASLDALSDLLLGDAVHQLTAGRFGRAASVADFAAAAAVDVPEPNLPNTERTGTTHPVRVLVLLDQNIVAPDGWPTTPRTRAHPALARLAACALPAPAATSLWCTTFDDDGEPDGSETLTLEELLQTANDADQIGPLDLLGAGDSAAPGTALHARLNRLSSRLQARPTHIDTQRTDGLPAGHSSFHETLAAAQTLSRLLAVSRPLRPEDLSSTKVTAQPDDITMDLVARADAAAGELASAISMLASALDDNADPNAVVDALLHADSVGLTVAVPAETVGRRAAAESAVAAAAARHRNLPPRPVAGSTSHQLINWARDVLTAIFGSGLPAVEGLDPADVDSLLPAEPDADAAHAWLSRAATVRGPIRELHTVDLLAAAQGRPWRLSAIRTPTGQWSPTPGAPGTLDLLTLHPPTSDTPRWSGIVVDEWAHTVPDATLDTTLTFHHPTPSASPAQLLLLAVPEPSMEEWTAEILEKFVDEALHLAREVHPKPWRVPYAASRLKAAVS